MTVNSTLTKDVYKADIGIMKKTADVCWCKVSVKLIEFSRSDVTLYAM